PTVRRAARTHLERAAHRAAPPGQRAPGGRVSTVSDTSHTLAQSTEREIAHDRARAERVAAARRRREALQNLAIRLISLASFLALWQVGAMNVDPVLFTTPAKVAVAAYDMLATGELWAALWPSLLVLLMGLTLAIVFGTLLGLALAR